MSEYLVGSPAFKAGDTGDPRMAGSIPVHLRQFVVGVLLVVLLVALGSTTAHGAARVLSSVPADGASADGLEEIVFDFDSLLLPEGAMVTITRLDGTEFSVSDISVDRTSLRASGPADLPAGNYAVTYAVRSSDGALNEGSIRVEIADPGQSFSGGLIAVVAIMASLTAYVGLVFRSDKMRRPKRT